jgi:hypothetical protein
MIDASLVAPDVAPLLWHGSLPPLGPETAASGFALLVLCNREPHLASRLFPGVEVLHCPLPDEGGLSDRDVRMACGTAERLAELHAERVVKRAANLRYAAARAEDAASFVSHARGPRRDQAAAEVEALRNALAQAHADPAARLPARWSPQQQPLTAQLGDVARSAIVKTRRRPATPEEHLVLGWAALRAAEGHRILVACLQGAGLVCALTLHVLTGRPGTYCAQLVRRARSGALTNADMLERLAGLPARRVHAAPNPRRHAG